MHSVQIEGGVISSNYQDVVESFDEMNLREELLVSTPFLFSLLRKTRKTTMVVVVVYRISFFYGFISLCTIYFNDILYASCTRNKIAPLIIVDYVLSLCFGQANVLYVLIGSRARFSYPLSSFSVSLAYT